MNKYFAAVRLRQTPIDVTDIVLIEYVQKHQIHTRDENNNPIEKFVGVHRFGEAYSTRRTKNVKNFTIANFRKPNFSVRCFDFSRSIIVGNFSE